MDYVKRWGVKRASALAQLAVNAGHKVELHHREPPPEFPKGHHKWWATCSCGWKTIMWWAPAGARIGAINHLAQIAADENLAGKSDVINGGLSPQKSVQPYNVSSIGAAKEVGS